MERKPTVKMKAYMMMQVIRFLVFILLFAGLVAIAFGQEDQLQGAWFDECSFVMLMFYDKSYEMIVRGRPQVRGEFTVKENMIIWKPTHFYSSAFDITSRKGWYSREEAIAEFAFRVYLWFEPSIQTFSINGDILTLVSDFSEQQFIRIQQQMDTTEADAGGKQILP